MRYLRCPVIGDGLSPATALRPDLPAVNMTWVMVIDEGTTHVIATPDDTTPLTTQTLLARGEVDALLNPNALWVLAADWAAVAPDAQLAFMSATLLQMSGAVLDGVEWIIFAGRPITDDDLIALAETLR